MTTNFANQVGAVILAAGKGTRMKAGVPKVMLEVGGKPMIRYPIKALRRVGIKKVVVVIGYQGEKIIDLLGNEVKYVWQKKRLGNAHALAQARHEFANQQTISTIISLQGDDSFLYSPALLADLIKFHLQKQAVISVLTIKNNPAVPLYFWRVGLKGRKVNRMISSTEALKLKSLVGSQAVAGSYCFANAWLWPNLKRLLKVNKKAGEEYYLPDLLPLALAQGGRVFAYPVEYGQDWLGVNTPAELERARETVALAKKRNQ